MYVYIYIYYKYMCYKYIYMSSLCAKPVKKAKKILFKNKNNVYELAMRKASA